VTERALRRALQTLAERHGPQGWWPVHCERKSFRTPCDARHRRGYHPGEFDLPRTRRGRWEIVTGAVLTQNTAWSNVELALAALRGARLFSPEALLACELGVLRQLVRPAGYFNQKSRYLQAVAQWFIETDRALLAAPLAEQTVIAARPVLLAVRGVGPETADSILLYAYGLPTFVIDAYTRRVLGGLGLVEPNASYERLRQQLQTALREATPEETVRAWQEDHALLVQEAKQLRRAAPPCRIGERV
jgi:endonuclease-3 related protein